MFLIITAIMYLAAGRATSQSLIGSWKNQLGSTLHIETVNDSTGLVTGYYTSPEGTSGERCNMQGWINSSSTRDGQHQVTPITFSVRWGEYGSVTAWSGYYELRNGEPAIFTVWHLVRSSVEFSYEHVIAGSDIFTKEH